MPRLKANHIELEYEQFGDKTAVPIVLIMGLYGQLIDWPDSFCKQLVTAGFQVIRFDNRDIGFSQKLDHMEPPGFLEYALSISWWQKPPAPYNLDDMAEDVLGLMDGLGIERVHIVGSSMGGMIGQILAAGAPDRILSLCCLSSTTGNPFLPTADWRLWPLVMNPAYVFGQLPMERKIELLRLLESPDYPTEDSVMADLMRAREKRSPDIKGLQRQLAAALNTGDISARLSSVKCPALVLHGGADPFIRPACGKDIARKIARAEFELIEGWGHDFPEALSKVIAEKIIDHCTTAEASAGPGARTEAANQE